MHAHVHSFAEEALYIRIKGSIYRPLQVFKENLPWKTRVIVGKYEE